MSVSAVVQKVGEKGPAKPRVFHEEVIDAILLNPTVMIKDLAQTFGVSPQWMMIIVNSDAFQKRLHERRKDMVDPLLRATLEDRMKGLMAKSLEVLHSHLEAKPDPKIALAAIEATKDALGYGAKPSAAHAVANVQFVVQAPPPAANARDWSDRYAPGGPVIEAPVLEK